MITRCKGWPPGKPLYLVDGKICPECPAAVSSLRRRRKMKKIKCNTALEQADFDLTLDSFQAAMSIHREYLEGLVIMFHSKHHDETDMMIYAAGTDGHIHSWLLAAGISAQLKLLKEETDIFFAIETLVGRICTQEPRAVEAFRRLAEMIYKKSAMPQIIIPASRTNLRKPMGG